LKNQGETAGFLDNVKHAEMMADLSEDIRDVILEFQVRTSMMFFQLYLKLSQGCMAGGHL
jgi:hypothetical protein